MKTPRINPEDPKWTAYVLGELDEKERLEMESLLEVSDEARALVEELQVASDALKDELMTLSPGLLAEQRAAVRQAAEPWQAPTRRGIFALFTAQTAWGVGLAAASIALLFGALPLLLQPAPESQIAYLQESEPQDLDRPDPASAARNGSVSASAEVANATAAGSQAAGNDSRQLDTVPGTAVPVVTLEEFARRVQESAPPISTPLAGMPATLRGTVSDPTGAVMPGVTVTAANTQNGVTTTALSDETGRFTIAGLPAGDYNVTAMLPGFQRQTVANVPLMDATEARHNFTLQLAQSASSMEASVDFSKVRSTSSASVGAVLSENRPLYNAEVAIARDGVSVGGIQAAPQLQQGPVTGVSGAAVAQGQLSPAGRGGRGGGAGRGAAATAVQGVRSESAVAAAPPPPPPAPPAPASVLNKAADRLAPASGNESYADIVDNRFVRATEQPLATFSIDVDTASYSNVRRFLNQNQLPPREAVRIEELINYFSYSYAQPPGTAPIAPNMEVASAPWNPQHRLVRIGIKAREINVNRRPPSNLVFLVDVSGSMMDANKLPLVKSGLKLLVNNLGENDFVSMVVYAGASGLVLPPTSGARKDVIHRAIDDLQAGGSTNGGAGLQLAYNQAAVNFIRNGVNRVILMTDGDFNVGITSQDALTRLIEDRAKSGVFLSVLGFGVGNLKDSTMERLADKGNGHYAYIDTLNEARKVLVEEMGSTLVTVAKDVKIQVDFNPGRVEAYRLIGYENRVLQAEDFNNDLKDAGEMGAGHTVTALFEVVPRGRPVPGPSIDPSRYQAPAATEAARPSASSSNELLTLRVRYKLPDATDSTRMDIPLVDRGAQFSQASTDFRFAASVAGFGMILRDSPYRGNWTFANVLDIASGSRGQDRTGYRDEFITLVRKASSLR
jgi:Ca-activated chloride channel family protein